MKTSCSIPLAGKSEIKEPLRATAYISPSDSSMRKASFTGVVLTPRVWLICRSLMGAPAASSPVMIIRRMMFATCSRRGCASTILASTAPSLIVCEI